MSPARRAVGVVARKDFRDARRSKLLWGLTTLFVLFTGLITYASSALGEVESAVVALSFAAGPAQIFVPLAAFVGGYMAVVGERRAGSLKLLLGFPVTRGDALLGKALGRAAVVAVTVLLGFAGAAALAPVLFGSLPTEIVGLTAATLLLGLACTGYAVGVSGAVSTRGRAMGLVVGAFVAFTFLWRFLLAGGYYLLNGGMPGKTVPAWYLLAERLNPLYAYADAAEYALGRPIASIVTVQLRGGASSLPVAEQLQGAVPVYLDPWSAVAILALWALVPLTVAAQRFGRADLG